MSKSVKFTLQDLADFMNIGWAEVLGEKFYMDDNDEDLWNASFNYDSEGRNIAKEPERIINIEDFDAAIMNQECYFESQGSLSSYFKKWMKSRTTATFVVHVPKEFSKEALVALLAPHKGKVL